MNDSNSHWDDLKRQREESKSEFISALSAHGAHVASSGHLRCPFHDDKHPSATIRSVEGKWFFSCHAAGCNVTYDIWDLTGMLAGGDAQTALKEYKKEVLDEYDEEHGRSNTPDKKSKPAKRKPSGFDSPDACIDYVLRKRNEQGEPVAAERKHRYTCPETGDVAVVVCRLRNEETGKKSYTQAFRTATGRYVAAKPDDFGPTPLYNRKRLAGVENILVVEGEWAVEAFTRLKIAGWAATTTMGGAGKSSLADLSPLAGKNVWLWADNDEYDVKLKRFPGEHHMQEIADALLKLEPAVSIKRVRHEDLDLPIKGDLVDYLEAVTVADDIDSSTSRPATDPEKAALLKHLFQNAEDCGIMKGFEERLNAIIRGEYKHIHIPDSPMTSDLTQAFLPRTVTLFPGDPGVAKSFWILEKFWKLHEAGWKVKLLMLEEDLEYWQQRTLAQMAGRADMTTNDWIEQHGTEAADVYRSVRERIASFSRRMSFAPIRPTLEWCASWVETNAADNDILGIDPITAASGSDKAWLDDANFLFLAKEAIIRHNSRLVLTTHPKKQDAKANNYSLDSIAGGAAYPRFSQTVLWMKKLDKPKDSSCDPGDGSLADYTHDRELRVMKARNGRGQGTNLAYILDRSSLTFVEAGQIVDTDR